MKFLRLYIRVLEMLRREARLGWILAAANLALATATFVRPILFGRIVDMPRTRKGIFRNCRCRT
jgi:ATP-binding cassette subfamily B protein